MDATPQSTKWADSASQELGPRADEPSLPSKPVYNAFSENCGRASRGSGTPVSTLMKSASGSVPLKSGAPVPSLTLHRR